MQTTSINVDIPYTLDTGEKLVNETFGPNNIHRRHIGTMDPRAMQVENGRPRARDFSLDKNGFMFVAHDTAVPDFFDQANLQAAYYPEVEQLIQKLSGAARVVAFDHTLRSGAEAERAEKLVREPILSAHNDYTEWSAPQRVRDLLPAEAEKAAHAPFRDHPGLARDQSTGRIQSARHCRRAKRSVRRSARCRTTLSESRRADLPAALQPAPPLVLFSAHDAQ
jgi:hypothetical protein